MIARLAVLVAVIAVALVGFVAPSVAGPAPQGSDPSVSAVNRTLAALAVSPGSQSVPLGVRPPAVPATAPASGHAKSLLLSPAIMTIAAHFTKAERLLHFQSHGIDANFWGAFNGGRGMKVQYTFKF
jgi:hypothetical protein